MDCNLQGLYNSREWRKNLHGYLAFNDGTELLAFQRHHKLLPKCQDLHDQRRVRCRKEI